MSSTAQQQQAGPPYALPTAQMGGLPLIVPDVPISAVFMFLFICSAATHMTIFQLNRKREHKFVFSALLFGFSMARIMTFVMRIVWATRPTNTQIAIAAGIFVQAGVVLLYIVNLFFTQRIVFAYHPRLRSFLVAKLALRVLVTCVVLLLIMVIIVTVHSLYTLDPTARLMDRQVQLFAGTFLALLAFLPIPIVLVTILAPRSREIEKFGTGRLRTKVRLLLFTSALCTLNAGWRVGSSYAAAPQSDPQWFNHKAAFYTIIFTTELIVSFTYALSRFDRRFHVPDRVQKGQAQDSNDAENNGAVFSPQVQTETDVFGAGEDNSENELAVEAKDESRRDSGLSDEEKATRASPR